MKVTATIERSGDTVVGGSLDKTYREIENAQALMFVENVNGFQIVYPEYAFGYSDTDGGIAFVEITRKETTVPIPTYNSHEFSSSSKDGVLTLIMDN